MRVRGSSQPRPGSGTPPPCSLVRPQSAHHGQFRPIDAQQSAPLGRQSGPGSSCRVTRICPPTPAQPLPSYASSSKRLNLSESLLPPRSASQGCQQGFAQEAWKGLLNMLASLRVGMGGETPGQASLSWRRGTWVPEDRGGGSGLWVPGGRDERQVRRGPWGGGAPSPPQAEIAATPAGGSFVTGLPGEGGRGRPSSVPTATPSRSGEE